jgi:hypothetical protein
VVHAMDHGANRPGFVVSQGENRVEAIRIAEQAFQTLKFEMR